jgi:23S rRNA (uracil1939-C5)-methyltransferase
MIKLCQHYLDCGGCELQHLDEIQYSQYKFDSFLEKLAKANIAPTILNPLFIVGPYKRRRCTVQINYHKGKIELGFYKKKSHQVVDMKECLILEPTIFNLLQPLRKCLASLAKPQLLNNIYILNSHTGLDLLINAEYLPNMECLEKLVEFANQHNIARISWQMHQKIVDIFTAKPVTSNINNILVELPVGCFLQATKECEQLIQQQILNLVVKNHIKKVVDLYAGCGTFSLIFDDKIQVHAVEGEEKSINAINKAIKKYNLKNKQATTQDLYRYPIKTENLTNFDLAIIDPPRNGASPQIKELAKSKIKTIMLVSCNVDSFIRDAKLLIAHGYKLMELTPIDQFYWTKHLELSAIFHF